MKKEVKELWVRALRSGTYEQGTHKLKYNNRFCCLGVLCDLGSQQKICKTEEYADGFSSFDGMIAILPITVSEWAGFSSNNPKIIYQGIDCPLTDLNDHAGLTFNQIANLIEEQL